MKKLFFPSIALNLVFLLGLLLLSTCSRMYQQDLLRKKVLTHQERRNLQFEALPAEAESYLFWGDARMEEINWDEFFENQKIKNRGNVGELLADNIKNVPAIVKSKPAKLFLLMGYQDLEAGKKPDEVFKMYADLINEIRKQSPKTAIYVHSLPATAPNYHKIATNDQILIFNAKLKDLAQKFELYYIDLWNGLIDEVNNTTLNAKYTNDGFHLNATGYVRWKSLIERYVKQ